MCQARWRRQRTALTPGPCLTPARFAAVLGGEQVLQMLVEPLGSAQGDWRTAEAALFCIRCARLLTASPKLARPAEGWGWT